jgi:hypothetical protein
MAEQQSNSRAVGGQEEWRPVPCLPEYEASNLGRIRTTTGRMLGQWPNYLGYLMVRIRKPRCTMRVHRLVAAAFIPNPDNKPYINHIDCNPANNHVSNLEWCTQLENLRHSARLGRMRQLHRIGKRSPKASLTDDQVRDIRQIYSTGEYSTEAIGQMFAVSKWSVRRVLRGKTYTYVQ